MSLFRPAEIRAVLVLAFLVFIGSTLTLLKRQGRLSDLELDIFLDNDRYKYSYKVEDLAKEKRANDVQPINGNNINSKNHSEKNQIVDLNTAGYFDLQALPGIGPVLAERIMAYRDSVGAFRSIEELLKVEGIGEKKYAGIKNRITAR